MIRGFPLFLGGRTLTNAPVLQAALRGRQTFDSFVIS
jgi:hypothetical protein